jgi:hypothetical protein
MENNIQNINNDDENNIINESNDNLKSTDKTPLNKNDIYTPAQLDLGLLVQNPTDEMFEHDADDEKEETKKQERLIKIKNKDNISETNTYNVVNGEDLESIHGDNSVILSDIDDDDDEKEDNYSFSKESSDDDDKNNYKKKEYNKPDRHYDIKQDIDENDTPNKRRKIYIQIKQYCKRKNIDMPTDIHPDSTYRDLKSYLNILREEQKMEKSVEMCKKILVGVTSVFEYLNHRFNPIGLKMDGWSENVNDNKDEYDEVFEELYEKYQEKVDVPAEVKLMMMIGGSAAQYHVMNSIMSGTKNKSNKNENKEQISPIYKHNDKTNNNKSHQKLNNKPYVSRKTQIEKMSDPDDEENKDIQDILRQIKNQNKNKNKNDDDQSISSLSSTATSVRRKRNKKRVSINDI